MENAILVYTTAPVLEAPTLARRLVEEKLAACANLMATHTAIYHWYGEVKVNEETAILLKTAPDKLAALLPRLQQLHPYEMPVILHWQSSATPDTLTWLHQSTRAE